MSLSQGQEFNFLSRIPEAIRNVLKQQGEYNSNNPSSAFLQAEVNPTTSFPEGLSENMIPFSFAFSNMFSNIKVEGKTRDKNSVFSNNVPELTRIFPGTMSFSYLEG
ncbi:hypothetical protein [Nostoc sp.]|uniref:hypothetical protein n=1 Tax=Nostoc sp. TaxID=1180 RepID=UPI002FF61968